MPDGTFFNGPAIFKPGQNIDRTCFHGIRQDTLKDCEYIARSAFGTEA